MKVKIVLVSVILGVLIAFWLSGVASADTTGSVTPIVHVIESYSGSLTIGGDVVGGVMDFGELVPGGEAVTKTLNLGVTANAGWQVTVTTTQNLRYANTGDTIPPDKFTFTSSGCFGPTYVTADTQFRTIADVYEDEVNVDVVTDGSEIDGCEINVVYRLEVPDGQPQGYYSAGNHIYTLIVSD